VARLWTAYRVGLLLAGAVIGASATGSPSEAQGPVRTAQAVRFTQGTLSRFPALLHASLPQEQEEDERATQLVACEVPDADSPLNPSEETVLALINGYRVELGLPALQLSATLQRAARWKATALATGGPRELTLADHDDPFRTWDQRILDCGYPAWADFGENLGGTDASPELLLQAWKDSPTHDANLRDPRWTHIGIATATTADGFTLWVADFGTTA
jgi:uncharacterized protein YkwD